jgi:broad specificity phosphatase PhoE
MTTFYLIRHGKKEGVPGNPSLVNSEKSDVKLTAKYLKTKRIKKIFSSPMKRTMETSGIIAKELGLRVMVDKRLRERLNWGDKVGETWEDFWSEWQKTDLDRDYQPSYGYSSREAGKRLQSFMEEISKKCNDKAEILIVTHGGIIGDLLRNIFPIEKLPHKINKISGAKYIEILECSITMLKKDRAYTLEKINNISHLSKRTI